jgi:hypothetical protein
MHVGLCHPRVLIILLIGFMCLFAGWAANSEAEGLPIVGSPSDRAADFDQMWHEVSDNYVYLGDRAASWGGARSRYTAQVAGARTLDEWTSVLETSRSSFFHALPTGIGRKENSGETLESSGTPITRRWRIFLPAACTV